MNARYALLAGLLTAVSAAQTQPPSATQKPSTPATTTQAPASPAPPATPTAPAQPWADIFQALTPREFGPTSMGGRITDLAVYNRTPRIFYVASASGGLWKTVNGGNKFVPVFQNEATVSLGAATVAQDNPDLVWVGTGEGSSRNSVAWGDGVYKSIDGGKTWKNMGLPETRFIGHIAIDPHNDDVVYVAALGHLWGPNNERGVYKTTDGGKTWANVLQVDPQTGAVDVEIDPNHPNNVLVAFWQRLRTPFALFDGGPGSGIYKSSDAGKSWHKVTKGLPKTDLGRIGLAIAPSNPKRVVATVEAAGDDNGTYLSDDGGESWKKVNPLNPRPFYFSRPAIDPTDPDHFFLCGYDIHETKTGGKTFKSVSKNIHPDHHAFWIDPADPAIMMDGNDGGLVVTRDGAATWEMFQNLPVGQFYHVSADMRRPYWVYGGLQDNNAWGFPSQGRKGGVGFWDGMTVAGGDGFYTAVDPTDSNTVYAESQNMGLVRTDLRTGDSRFIKPSSRDDKLRFNWNAPFILSPFNPRTIYGGANRLMKSVDRGDHWKPISPDLTTNDPKTFDKGEGPLQKMTSGAETHCTITTISESPRLEGLIWVGTDDGKLQITKDGGTTWSDLTPNIPGLPPLTWCTRVTASRWDVGRAYATFDGHRNENVQPYLYETDDFGKTWKNLSGSFPKTECLYTIREGVKNQNLLIAGGEFGLYFSLNQGAQFTKYTNGFPTVAVHDVLVHPKELDLVIATHGRSLWILDINPLEQIDNGVVKADAAIYAPQDVLMLGRIDDAPWSGDKIWTSPNTQPGTQIFYYLAKPIADGVQIKISDISGERTREIHGKGLAGLNVVKWDGRLRGSDPGTYSVSITVGGKEYKTTVNVVDATLPG